MNVLKALGCLSAGMLVLLACGVVALNLVVSSVAAQLPFGRAEVRAWQLGTPVGSGPIAVGGGSLPGGGSNPNPGEGGAPGAPARGITPWATGGAGQCADGAGFSHSGTPAFSWPTLNHGLSGYDWLTLRQVNGSLQPHVGIDLIAREGDPIYAAADGVVTWAGWEGWAGYGNLIVLDHGEGWATRYAHLSQVLALCEGAVGRGTLIGLAGNTGRSNGAHLHFEILGTWSDAGGAHWGAVNPWCFLPGSPPEACT
jgi:murein DD-endopeptidase MepM/ murein hydrolase activator NlpD